MCISTRAQRSEKKMECKICMAVTVAAVAATVAAEILWICMLHRMHRTTTSFSKTLLSCVLIKSLLTIKAKWMNETGWLTDWRNMYECFCSSQFVPNANIFSMKLKCRSITYMLNEVLSVRAGSVKSVFVFYCWWFFSFLFIRSSVAIEIICSSCSTSHTQISCA